MRHGLMIRQTGEKMRTIKLENQNYPYRSSAPGCMKIDSLDKKQAASYVANAVEQGVDFFDTADIYAGGNLERVLGKAIVDAGIRREDVIIQSKCGIIPGQMYDLSREHILASVDGILRTSGHRLSGYPHYYWSQTHDGPVGYRKSVSRTQG